MSNENISVGDLVVVVKPSTCCGSLKAVGKILTVVNRGLTDRSKCTTCGKIFSHTEYSFVALSTGKTIEITRLRKIPPLPELTSTEIKEEIPA